MNTILKTLYHSFYTPLPLPEEEEEINTAHQELFRRLDKPERKLVLQIIDAKDAVIDARSMDSFICGFRLAWQLAMELNTSPQNKRPTQTESTGSDACPFYDSE